MGIISSNTIQVGRRLVKTFGEGQNLKKVVTETLEDGNILTRVFNNEGKQLTERLKKVGNMEEVGDKLVKTTKVVKDEEGVITKQVRDRVYDSSSYYNYFARMRDVKELMKELSKNHPGFTCNYKENYLVKDCKGLKIDDPNATELQNLLIAIRDNRMPLGERVANYSESGNILKKILKSFKSDEKSGTRYYNNLRQTRSRRTRSLHFAPIEYYNDKGLPYPDESPFMINTGNAVINMNKMTLRDMRRLYQKYCPGEKYSVFPSLAKLDEPVEGDKITKLGKFL